MFPDHVAARITAIAALAAMIRRLRTGSGAHVHISQAEIAVNQLATAYVSEAAALAGLPVVEDDAVHVVAPCAGDDEWCVVSVRSAADRATLAGVLGAEPPADRAGLIAAVHEYTATRDKADVVATLQAAGIPAGPMNRPVDVHGDPQVRFRALYTEMAHPLFDEPLPTETGPTRYRNIPPAELRPAPQAGEHTRDICQKTLALEVAEIDRLIADGSSSSTPSRGVTGDQRGSVHRRRVPRRHRGNPGGGAATEQQLGWARRQRNPRSTMRLRRLGPRCRLGADPGR